jgi:5'(3')-deoxyribonucleotidase
VKKRICIDMDEVIADSVGEHLLRYNRGFNTNVTTADLHGKHLWECIPVERQNALDSFIRADDFFAVLDVMPDAPRVIERLQSKYEVFIATAAMEVPTSFAAKFAWLGRHFPFIPPSHIVYCGDKGILLADYLIDDNARQLRTFQGEGILYTSPHNANVTGYTRVDDWLAVEKLFLS